MASMQCYKTAYETRQQKCNDNFLAHTAMKGSHHGHDAGYHMASSQTQCYGQTKTQYPDYPVAKTQTHCYSQTNSHHTKEQAMAHGHGHGHGHGLHVSHGMVCHGKTEKKMKEKKSEYKKKEKSVYKKKSKECNRSSDSDSSSGCDSD